MPALIEELKQKKVVEWALGYLAGAFVVLQLMDALDGALGLSQQTEQSIVALVATGLVVTTIIAWFHGDKGHQRVTPAEVLALTLTLALGISVCATLWLGQGAAAAPAASAAYASGSVLPSLPEGEAPGGRTTAEREPLAGQDLPTDTRSWTGDAEEPATSEALDGNQPGDRGSAVGQHAPPALEPENPVLFVGDSVRLQLDTDAPAHWTTSDRSVAMVTSDGLVLGVGSGSARIAASVRGGEVSTDLTVRAVTASAVDISSVGTLRPGASVRPDVVVRMTNGQTRGGSGLHWSSTDTSVVEVDRRGTLVAKSPGSARITAERDRVTGSIEVVVEDEPAARNPTPPVSADVLFPVLERYRTALEAQDMDGVSAVYPSLSDEERGGWSTLFRLGELSVGFSELTVVEASPTTATVEFEQMLTGNRIERNVTRFTATLTADGGGWRIRRLHAIDAGR